MRGIDAEIAYRHRFQGIGTFNTRFTYTHNFQNDQFLNPTNPNFADQQLLELGFPKDQFEWNVDLQTGPIQLHYKMRYIGRMLTSAYEDYFSKNGNPPQNSDVNNIEYLSGDILPRHQDRRGRRARASTSTWASTMSSILCRRSA